MKPRINLFSQIGAFYSFVFDNQEKVNQSHVSLYMFLLNQNNRSNWSEWFKSPYDLAMAGACIGSKSTYYKCLNDLQEWKLIKYLKGKNDAKAPMISIIQLSNNEPLTVPLSEPLTVPLSGNLSEQLSVLLTGNIDILITDNYKLITDNIYKWIETELATDQKPKKSTFEDRKLKFASTLEPFVSIYGRNLLNEFYKYWTEPNKSGTKFRQEMERTWDLSRRLETWSRNDKNFKNNQNGTKERITADEQIRRAVDRVMYGDQQQASGEIPPSDEEATWTDITGF